MSAGVWLVRARWALLAVLVLFFLALALVSHAVTDWLWFRHLGYAHLFTTPLLWRLGVGFAAGLAAFLFLWVNLAVARQNLLEVLARRYEGAAGGGLARWSRRIVLVAAAVPAFFFGASLSERWPVVAQGVYGAAFGVTDPLFGRDVSFYVFSLPWYDLLNSYALGLAVLAGLIAGGVYAASGAFMLQGLSVRLAPRARVHLSLLLTAFAVLLAVEYHLRTFELLYSTRGAVYGASYVDVRILLPGLRLLSVVSLVLAAAAVANLFRPALRWVIAAGTLLVAASFLGGGLLPHLVQEFVVRPNELELELPFIAHHTEMTRRAYGLDQVEERTFVTQIEGAGEVLARNPWLAGSVRLWDWRPLLDTYAQIQSLRPYYDFIEVDVDRYRTRDGYRQVMLSARELNPAKLQNRTWVNEHLQYTHGYGAVVSPVNEASARGLPNFLLENIPPQTVHPEFALERPEIYYGEMETGYAVVRTRRPEFDYPQGSENVTTFYQGTGGVPLGGFLRRALFAARFGTTRLVLSADITAESRIMFRRAIGERVRTLAPFLRYDRDPYLVIADGRLFWMIDAYTTTDRYPYAVPVRGWGNYVRNAVKVVIDAYNGTVDFYLANPEPLVEAWARIFPGTFKPIDEMPASLRAHVRYPEDLFVVQATVLTRYHMRNPQVFYNQEDVWEMPREIYEQREVAMQPYYVITRLPEEEEEEFLLMLPFTPVGKRNLVAWLAARIDGLRYGELVLYTFDKQELTFGPMQFEAQVNQDTEISAQLTLWGQQGSRVIRGNLIILPVGGTLLYVEPLFLQAESSSMPELKRVIVGLGERILMRESFAQAFAELAGTGLAAAPPGSAGAPGGPTPAPAPAPGGGQGAAGGARQLAERAAQLLAEAQRHAAAGSWSEYGRALDALAATLAELEAAFESVPAAP